MTFVAGASASIMKTLNEIEKILAGQKLSPSGPKRKALREKLQGTLIKSSKIWYKKGFNRGHKESFRAYKQKGLFPNMLEVEVKREFLPKSKDTVKLKSTLKKSFRGEFA